MPTHEPRMFETLSERGQSGAAVAWLHPVQALPSGQALSVICLLAPKENDPKALELSGLEGASLYPCGPFWLLAEPVWLHDWTGVEGDAHLSDLSWVGPRALRHARQIEELSRQAPVFPMPLGTLFSGVERAAERFERQREVILAYLQRAREQLELGVKVSFDRKALEQRLMEEAPESTQVSGRVSGAAYLLRQRRMRDLAVQVRGFQQVLLEGLLEALRPHCLAFLQLKRIQTQASEDDWEVAASFAFLVEKKGQEGFLEVLEREASAVTARCGRVELTGPWPPYSFRPSLQDAEGAGHVALRS